MTKDQIEKVRDLIYDVGFDRFEDNVIKLIRQTNDPDADITSAITRYLHIHSKLLDDFHPISK